MIIVSVAVAATVGSLLPSLLVVVVAAVTVALVVIVAIVVAPAEIVVILAVAVAAVMMYVRARVCGAASKTFRCRCLMGNLLSCPMLSLSF